MVRISRLALGVASAVILSAALVAAAHAAYTSSVASDTATMTGNAADDFLNITRSGTTFAHNRFGTDAGYASVLDFSSLAGPAVTLPAATGRLAINSGLGGDSVQLSVSDGPASAVTHTVNLGDGAGSDYLSVSELGAPVTATVTATRISGYRIGNVDYDGAEILYLYGATLGDRFNVIGIDQGSTITSYGGGGDDVLSLADGVGLRGGTFTGDAGTDTVDLSSWTRPATVTLGTERGFNANLDEANVVPPGPNDPTEYGYAGITLDPVTGGYYLTASAINIPPANIVAGRLRNAAAGANGPIIETFDADRWQASGPSSSLYVYGLELSDAQADELRGGRLYFEIQTSGASSPQRGQIAPGDLYGQVPDSSVTGIESVTGGSAADSLVGSELADSLRGGPGADGIGGGEGPDNLDGGPGLDLLSGGGGDDSLAAGDGEADALSCGAGADSVTADHVDIVAADCETVARVGTPPASPPSGSPALTNASFARVLTLDVLGRPFSARRTVKVGRDRRAGLAVVSCRSDTPCTAEYRIFIGKAPARPFASARVGSGRFRVPAGDTRAAALRLTGAGMKALRRAGTSKAVLAVRVRDGSGRSRTSTSALKLRR